MLKSIVKILALPVCGLVALFNVTCAGAQKTSAAHPAWSHNLAIYEVNIRQHTPEGTFKAFEAHLPKLKEMGVGIVWLMPIHPIGEKNRKGSLGSYYSVADYTDVNPEFGTKADFDDLVSAIHDQDMYVIIDWVANHSAWDHPWTETDPDFYNMDEAGNFYPPVPDWSDVIDLNYDNPKMRDAMLEALEYWVREHDIDGYRCDVAAMVPTAFWNDVRQRLDAIKPVFMLAEAHEPGLHAQAFDMTYAWQYKDLFNAIAAGEKNAADLRNYYEGDEATEYHPDAYRMTFTTNHDENSWNGTVFERLGDGVETFAALTGVLRGMPLVYSGQEAGLNKALAFFEKDDIEWKDHPLREIYTRLFHLKRENPALWNGLSGGDLTHLSVKESNDVYAILREKDNRRVVGIFNLSGDTQAVTVAYEGLSGSYTNVMTDEDADLTDSLMLSLAPWEYRIWVK